jgi:hypothetical protein
MPIAIDLGVKRAGHGHPEQHQKGRGKIHERKGNGPRREFNRRVSFANQRHKGPRLGVIKSG